MLESSLGPTPRWWQSPGTEPILYAAATRLVALFGLRACRFEPFPFDGQLPRIEAGRIVLPPAEPGVAPWSGEPGIELAVRYLDLTLGRFVLVPAVATTGVVFPPADRAAAIAMAIELGPVVAAAMLAEAPSAPSPYDFEPPAGPVVESADVVPERPSPGERRHRPGTARHWRWVARRGGQSAQ